MDIALHLGQYLTSTILYYWAFKKGMNATVRVIFFRTSCIINRRHFFVVGGVIAHLIFQIIVVFDVGLVAVIGYRIIRLRSVLLCQRMKPQSRDVRQNETKRI